MIRAVTLLQQTTGISKVRITGGEPLLSPKFGDFLQGVMGLGLNDVALNNERPTTAALERSHYCQWYGSYQH